MNFSELLRVGQLPTTAHTSSWGSRGGGFETAVKVPVQVQNNILIHTGSFVLVQFWFHFLLMHIPDLKLM